MLGDSNEYNCCILFMLLSITNDGSLTRLLDDASKVRHAERLLDDLESKYVRVSFRP